MNKKFTLLLMITFSLYGTLHADPPKEVRGIWLTSVYNIDWPHSNNVSVAAQKERLLGMLDNMEHINMNAVFFQVRPNADALYKSSYDPWSHWVTGNRGAYPGYDPLAFLIQEAHKRGIEVHAWLNPYRFENVAGQFSGQPGDYSQTHPDLIITYNNRTYFDPGQPGTTQLLKKIIAELVTNYDLDGVIFDDYFYPSDLPTSYDQHTYDEYATDEFVKHYYSHVTRGNFRRAAVNHMIREVNDTIKSVNPSLLFGVSPGGIYSTLNSAAHQWGTELPEGITGNDFYSRINCDPLAWLWEGSVDYISPQLYWKIGGPQDFVTLTEWWGKEAERRGRHSYTSLGTYRLDEKFMLDAKLFDSIAKFLPHLQIHDSSDYENFMVKAPKYTYQEIIDQIEANRENEENNVFGTIFYRGREAVWTLPDLGELLLQEVYQEKSIFPHITWLDNPQDEAPDIAKLGAAGDADDALFMVVDHKHADRYLLQGQSLPGKSNLPFQQMTFGKDFNVFYGKENNNFTVAPFYRNRFAGQVSQPQQMFYLEPVSPADVPHEVCHGQNFSWSTSESGAQYTFMVMTGSRPWEIAYQSDWISDNSYSLESGILQGQENHIMRIMAKTEDAVSLSAPTHFFANYPMATTINGPQDGSETISLETTAQWNSVEGATSYHMQVATDSLFDQSSIFIDMNNLTGNMHAISLPEYNTRYFMRVRAEDNCGFSLWSSVSFKTRLDPATIDEPYALKAKVYPNPGTGIFYLTYNSPLNKRLLQVYSFDGRLLKEKKLSNTAGKDQIDLTQLPPGFYTVMVKTKDGGSFAVKIVKKNL